MSYQAIHNVQLNYVNTLHGNLDSIEKSFPGNDLNTPNVPTGIYAVRGDTLHLPTTSTPFGNGNMIIHLRCNANYQSQLLFRNGSRYLFTRFYNSNSWREWAHTIIDVSINDDIKAYLDANIDKYIKAYLDKNGISGV